MNLGDRPLGAGLLRGDEWLHWLHAGDATSNAAVNSGFRQYLTGIQNLLSPLTGTHHVPRRHGNPQDRNRHVTHGAHHNSFARADRLGATGVVRLAPLVPECLGDRLLAAVRPADGSLFPGRTLALHP